MRAARIHAYGTIDDIRFEDVREPVIGLDDVLVRVEAAALNPMDNKLMAGYLKDFFPLAFPYTLGTDLAGTVVATGALVAGISPGDKVIARTDPTAGGAFAELAAVPARLVARVSPDLALASLAGLPTAAGSAWQALFEAAAIRPGQSVLIHAGAGGVGSFAVQLASLAGAHVTATASAANLDLVHALGAKKVIDYRHEDFAAISPTADVVIDTIGGETLERSLGIIRPGGKLIGLSAPFDTEAAKARGIDAQFLFHQSDAGRLAAVAALAVEDRLQIVVGRQFPLADTIDAFRLLLKGGARGKILVRP
ncbi:NADPH:quinone reductase-like Zn-dependent oxidoreductase [Rhizobium pisi]|uniref:NADP-dependent oxidoreductase n=1 Tax=Rhizobium pisi TaxID=574561 RepID=A0A427N5D7_9HYPH|nr:NADP-dependent oxidoreductase [Rhizobium pisi]MBB3133515.1 NADPH:quinone reductase-like Zn-dependent oxidoreductase [Rhizobium pisi]RSB82097.1 NADP-dependent oxidoreductase [Rhizobium pisi]